MTTLNRPIDSTSVTPFTLPTLRQVASPRAARKLAFALALVFILLPLALLLVPWQQNIPGLGRVVALDPLDRTQIIPAPVSGRLVKLNVQEGTYVEQGDVLAEMADQDPLYSSRLQQQFEFARNKVDAAREQVDFYEDQLVNQEDAMVLALDSAQFGLNVAIEKVTGRGAGPDRARGRVRAEAPGLPSQAAPGARGCRLGVQAAGGRGGLPLGRGQGQGGQGQGQPGA